MTPEEKAKQMEERNAAICAYYLDGHRKMADCERKFQLGRQRILQILKESGAWRPYVKGDRTKFVGVNVSEETKDALKKKADEAGVSISRMVSDQIDEMVK
jgi:hypothetical protein